MFIPRMVGCGGCLKIWGGWNEFSKKNRRSLGGYIFQLRFFPLCVQGRCRESHSLHGAWLNGATTHVHRAHFSQSNCERRLEQMVGSSIARPRTCWVWKQKKEPRREWRWKQQTEPSTNHNVAFNSNSEALGKFDNLGEASLWEILVACYYCATSIIYS